MSQHRELTPTVSETNPMTPGQVQEYPVLGRQPFQSLRNVTNDHRNPQKAQMFNYKLVNFHPCMPIASNGS